MSHASGKVRFNDGTIMFYEYDGTADIVLPQLYETFDELHDNWRKQTEMKRCECGGKEEVEVYSSYGGGWYFTGRACKSCMKVETTEEELTENIHLTASEGEFEDDWAN